MAKSKKKFSLNDAKKYSIWVAIPVALVIALVVKTMATSKIETDFEKTKNELEGAKSAVQSIADDIMQPNQKTVDGVNKHTSDLFDNVVIAWGYLEHDQKEKNQWPAVLGVDFVTKVQNLKPGESLGVLDCERYRNFITDHLPTMIMSVDIRKTETRRYDQKTMFPAKDSEGNDIWDVDETSIPSFKNTPSSTGGGGGGYGGPMGGGGSPGGGFGNFGGGGGNPGGNYGSPMGGGGGVGGLGANINAETNPDIRRTGKVDWANPEIFSLVANLGQDRLNSVQIWCTQEDFWVYDALLWVIQTTNANAKGQHDAPVKRIESLLIGQQASPLLATLDKTIGSFGGVAASSSSSSDSSSSTTSDPSGSGSGASSAPGLTATAEQWNTYLVDRRYVDLENKPLLASATPPFREFNRMPICLRLIVDQQRIPDILTNCANCRMPIDIIQVRVNPGRGKPFNLNTYTASTGSSDGGSSGSESSGGDLGSYGSAVGATAGGEFGAGGSSTSVLGGSVDELGNEVFLVEIYGIINIFNSSQHSLQEIVSRPGSGISGIEIGDDETEQQTGVDTSIGDEDGDLDSSVDTTVEENPNGEFDSEQN